MTTDRDYLTEFDQANKATREVLFQAGRHANYLRTLLRDLRPHLPKDHPWLPGIDEQIALAEPTPVTRAQLENVARWLDEECSPTQAAIELRMMAQRLPFEVIAAAVGEAR